MLLAKELSLEVLIGEPYHSMLGTLRVGPDIISVSVEKGAGSDDVRKAEQCLGCGVKLVNRKEVNSNVLPENKPPRSGKPILDTIHKDLHHILEPLSRDVLQFKDDV